jgi:hypothetical protein
VSSRSQHLLLPVALCFVLGSVARDDALAQSSIDLERQRAELLQVHRNVREAHFNTNVDLLLDRASDELIYVRDGKIARQSKADMREFFSGYFRNAKYYEWDDIEPPIVHVSQDASMGWMITNVRVRRTQSTSTTPETVEFVYAGMSTYEKRGGRWMEVANVSTFEPRK